MDVKAELIRGLTSKPKYIPQWYRYDKQGSLYNDACLEQNQHYYLHRAEMSVLKDRIQEMIREAPNECVLVDLGSGNSAKTRLFIDALLEKQGHLTYIPVDISTEFIREVSECLSALYGTSLSISPVYGDYDAAIKSFRTIEGDKLIVWFGSLQNLSHEEQIRKLQMMSENMNDRDRLLLSIDITQDEEVIHNAYLDKDGYNANLHCNAVWRLNKEYGSDIDVDKFNLVGNFYRSTDPDKISKFAVRLRSIGEQTIDIPGLDLTLHLKDGEFLNLFQKDGSSCKYTQEQIRALVRAGNQRICKQWVSDDRHVIFCCLAKVE